MPILTWKWQWILWKIRYYGNLNKCVQCCTGEMRKRWDAYKHGCNHRDTLTCKHYIRDLNN